MANGGFEIPMEYEYTYNDNGNVITVSNTYPTTVGMYPLLPNNAIYTDHIINISGNTVSIKMSNYDFRVEQIDTDNNGSFEIQPLSAIIVPDEGQSIMYGQDVTTLTYKAYDPNSKVNGVYTKEIDKANFTGALKVDASLNQDGYLNALADGYNIVNDNISSANYSVQFDTSVKFKVNPTPVTVSLNGVDSSNTIKIIYGNDSPLIPLLDDNTKDDSFFPYTFTLKDLVASKHTGLIDYSPFAYSLSNKVALADDITNNCGTYNITLGTLRHDNYTFQFKHDYKIQVIPRPIVVIPNAGASHIYGNTATGTSYSTQYYNGSYPDQTLVAPGEAIMDEEFTIIDQYNDNVSSTIKLSKEEGSGYWMIRIAGMKQATHLVTSADEKVTELGGTLYAYEDGEELFRFTFNEAIENSAPSFTIACVDRDYDAKSYYYYLSRRGVLASDSSPIEGTLGISWYKEGNSYNSAQEAPVGNYEYNIGTLSSNNYIPSLYQGSDCPTYEITPRPLIIQLNGTVGMVFGNSLPTDISYTLFEENGYDESSHKPQITFTLPSGTLIPGSYPITVDISANEEANGGNFTFSFNAEEYTEYLIVSKRTITLTPAVGQTRCIWKSFQH